MFRKLILFGKCLWIPSIIEVTLTPHGVHSTLRPFSLLLSVSQVCSFSRWIKNPRISFLQLWFFPFWPTCSSALNLVFSRAATRYVRINSIDCCGLTRNFHALWSLTFLILWHYYLDELDYIELLEFFDINFVLPNMFK